MRLLLPFIIPTLIVSLVAFAILRSTTTALRSRTGAIAYWLALAAILAGWALANRGSAATGSVGLFGRSIRVVAGVWMASSLACVFVGIPTVLVKWAFRGVRWLATRRRRAPQPDVDPGRRGLLLGMALPASALVTGTVGTLAAMRGFVVRREVVRVPGLPSQLSGFRIGQITDVHLGGFVEVDYLRRAVEVLNAENVDLQVMTGDLIDDIGMLDPAFDALERCEARHNMLAILGNHEKWRGLKPILAAYEQRASRGRVGLLVDESTVLEHRGARVRVVGVDYPMRTGGSHSLPRAERNALMERSARKAFSGAESDEFIVCLSHHPDFFPFAAGRGAQLTLAGHTHGGQVAIDGKPFIQAFEYVLGRYRLNDSHLYVSGGAGHWLPFRLGVPAEIAVLTLEGDADRSQPSGRESAAPAMGSLSPTERRV